MLFGKHVNKYYIKYGLYFFLGVIALILVDIFQLEMPEIVGNIIDGLEYKTLNKDTLSNYMIQLLVIALIMFAGRFCWRICIFGNGIRIESDLRNDLFFSMQRLSQSFFSKNKTGELMALYTNDLNMIRRTFGAGTIMLVDALCLGVLAVIKMFQLNAVLSIISLSSLIIIMVLGQFIGKKITKATEANFKAYGRLSEYVQEDFSGIGVVKAFVKEKLQVKRFEKYNEDNMNSGLTMTRLSAKMQISISVLLNSLLLIIIGYGSYVIYQNATGNLVEFTIGSLTKFIAYYSSLIWPIQAVGRLIELRSQGKASLQRVSRIIDHEIEVNDNLVPRDFDKNEIIGKIEYRNLSFSYNYNFNSHDEEEKEVVLKNVSFTIKPGEFVGVVGETGVGKTTICDLLLRIYNVEEGTLFIDDTDIMHLPLKFVRDNVTYVPQDNFLFSDTIENNIAFSEDGIIDENRVIECAKLADVYNDIIEFNEGFKTVLGERGVTVSGGQKQRISIARALYKNASILILDDSLSAVDTETEKTIINNLRKIRHGKTTIIIAHRITTLQHLDKIAIVEDGTISGFGTHEELLKTNEAYAKEVRLQELEKEVGGDNNE